MSDIFPEYIAYCRHEYVEFGCEGFKKCRICGVAISNDDLGVVE